MKGRLLVILATVLLGNSGFGAEPRRIAFERGRDIWVVNLDGSDAKKITRGNQPDISPDGTKVAFHVDVEGSANRHIAIADMATKRVTIFTKEIPSANCQGAVWSPDRSKILFNLYDAQEWFIGLVNPDGTGFRYLKRAPGGPNPMWSACWAPDGDNIYAQNLDEISKRNLEGNLLKSWEIQKVIPSAGMTSASHMSVSPDGNSLLLDMEVTDEEVNRKDWDGPPPSIWKLDLTSEKAVRLTPKGLFGWYGIWLGNDEILFVSQAANEKQPSLWRMDSKGENRKLVVKNADRPSVSTK